MKKRLAMLVIGVMIALAGCGQSIPDAQTGQAEASAEVAETAEESDAHSSTAPVGAMAQVAISDENVATAAAATKEHVPMDISGCATFTDIVDKLGTGQGYTNARIGDTDVLMVTDYAYEYNGDGQMAAIDADIFRYNGDQIEYMGYITSGGTAYPLIIYDEDLYTAGNHFVQKYEIDDGLLKLDEEIYVEYDSDGNATYYKVEDSQKEVKDSNDDDVKEMYDYMERGTIITFDVIK